MAEQNAKTTFLRSALTVGTSGCTIFGVTLEARLSRGILPKMTYNGAGTNVLLTV